MPDSKTNTIIKNTRRDERERIIAWVKQHNPTIEELLTFLEE